MYLQDEGLDKVVKLHLKSSTQHQKQKIATIENENNSYLTKLQQTNLTLTDSKIKNFEGLHLAQLPTFM